MFILVAFSLFPWWIWPLLAGCIFLDFIIP
jgi:hypothetical protein